MEMFSDELPDHILDDKISLLKALLPTKVVKNMVKQETINDWSLF